MKDCNKCGLSKPLNMFKKNKKCSGGITGTCKDCVNKCLSEKRSLGLYRANRDKANKANRKYKENNRDSVAKKQSEYQKVNRARYNAYEAKRRAKLLLASVEWSCKSAVEAIYEQAKASGMEVDHIVPLQGASVCGLHWEGNLQLLTPAENRSKGNKL